MDYSNLSKEELIKIIEYLNGWLKVSERGKENVQKKEHTSYKIDTSDTYWKQIMDALPIITYIYDSLGFKWISKNMLEVSGYTGEEWKNMSNEERSLRLEFPEKPESLVYYEMFAQQGKNPEHDSVELEYRFKRKDGQWIWIYSTNSYIYNPITNDFDIVSAAFDITERKNREIEIERLNTELEEAILRERKLAEEKNALMQKEIDDKNRELNRLAIYLTEKNSCLMRLKKQATDLSKAGAKELKNMVAGIVNSIEQKLNSEAVWNTFEIQFESTNPHFMKNLMNLYPELTQMELRVCSLIKLNLSSKAISTILNTSSRTVDTHRLNIRKKMNLNDKEQLTKLLNSL